MPTVRGLIQYVQSQGLIHNEDISVLSGTTIGIDAIQYFESLYHQSLPHDILGCVNISGLQQAVQTGLRTLHKANITPIFVFPGIVQDDRINKLSTQLQTTIAQTQENDEKQQEQEQNKNNIDTNEKTEQNKTPYSGFGSEVDDNGVVFHYHLMILKKQKKIKIVIFNNNKNNYNNLNNKHHLLLLLHKHQKKINILLFLQQPLQKINLLMTLVGKLIMQMHKNVKKVGII